MFDPKSYRDTDFGLDTGESFEPEDAEESALVDLSQPYVMTVLGPIDPEDLGICLSHVQVIANGDMEIIVDPEHPLDHRHPAAEALESFALAGGRSVVDASTADSGRNISALSALAQHIPVHVIATTGRLNHFPFVDALDASAMVQQFVKELASGVDDSAARAGIISIGIHGAGIDDIQAVSLGAAANAHLVTGAPIAVRTENAVQAEDVLDVLEREGATTARVILQQLDLEPDIETVMRLADRGAWCSIDCVGAADSAADKARARRIVALLDAGFGSRILLSQVQEPPAVPAVASARLTYLLDWFTLALMEAGVNAAMVRSMLVDNPRQALAVIPPGAERAPRVGL